MVHEVASAVAEEGGEGDKIFPMAMLALVRLVFDVSEVVKSGATTQLFPILSCFLFSSN